MESNISNNFDEGFWRDVMYSDFGGDLKEILENMNDMIISVDCDDFNRIAKGKITNFISTLVSSDEDSFNVKNVRNIRCMFNKCYSFTGKGLENWDIRNVNVMSNTFDDCDSLKKYPNWYKE